MGTIVVRPTDTPEEIKQKVTGATSGDVVKFSTGDYFGVRPSDFEVSDGVELRIGGCTFGDEPCETEEATEGDASGDEEPATDVVTAEESEKAAAEEAAMEALEAAKEAHEAGLHSDDAVENCPLCQENAEAAGGGLGDPDPS